MAVMRELAAPVVLVVSFVVLLTTTVPVQSLETCQAVDAIISTRSDVSVEFTGACARDDSCSVITCTRPHTLQTNLTTTYTLDYCSPNVTLNVLREEVGSQGSTVEFNRTTTGNDTITDTSPAIAVTLVPDGDAVILGVSSTSVLFMVTRIPLPNYCNGDVTSTGMDTTTSPMTINTDTTTSPIETTTKSRGTNLYAAVFVQFLMLIAVILIIA